MARTPKHLLKRWIVCFRCHDGRFGEIGYITFETESQAKTWGEEFKAKTTWVKEIIVKHPEPFFSDY